jgi:hypothetical protein
MRVLEGPDLALVYRPVSFLCRLIGRFFKGHVLGAAGMLGK